MQGPKCGINQARLRSFLDYEPETGILRWTENCPQRQFIGTEAGTIKKSGYRLIRIEGVHHRAHRLAWLWMTGEWPPRGVDHKDTERSNNRWLNLRLASQSQNIANSRRWANKTAGLPKGVGRRPSGRFFAHIKKNRIRVYLGTYDTAEEANAAYLSAALELFGEFARAA